MRQLVLLPVLFVALVGTAKAAEPKVLFEDSFQGKLGDGWSWLRENKNAWRIEDNALEIRVEPGVANTVKNALLQKAPDRSKTRYQPVEQVPSVGLPKTGGWR